MDSNNIICPVCTLYLRPGITLKSHLASHPKQKVIEALVRLSHANEEPKSDDSQQTNDINTPSSSQVNTAIVNQSWNQTNSPSIPSNVTPIQGNHLFIYQQSMSTTSPQGNVLNINPLAQQYVIPTVFNPQMMPYVYQQQQVIMSSNSCVPPLRALPFELPSTSDNNVQSAVITEAPNEDVLLNHADLLEKEVESRELVNETSEFPSTSEEKENLAEDLKSDVKMVEELEAKDCKNIENLSDEDENDYSVDYGMEYDANVDHEECVGSPKSGHESEWDTRFHPELNKACQTQTTANPSTISNNTATTSTMLNTLDNASFPETQEEPPPEYYYLDQNIPNTSYSSNTFEQSDPIYTSTNILQSNDFIDMDGMQVIINDFTTAPIISQVDNPDLRPDRSSDLMTIGDMVTTKHDYSEHRDFDESMSRESSNVNIRTDERMPPRGELSGQESIGGASDIAWNRIHYQEGTSGMSGNSYDLMARESWEASDSSDVEVPPLQSRNPTNFQSEIENDTPTIVSFTGPPMNFKCSTCGDDFASSKDRKEHEIEKHPEKCKVNIIGADIGRKKVKKIVVKPRSEKLETENNFDNVFTNKLKLETQTEAEQPDLPANQDPLNPNVKVDVVNMELKVLCSICDSVLENIKALKVHKFEVHNVAADVRHKCATCGLAFQNEFKFTEHLRVHPLECRMCGKLFYRRQNFQLHMKRHLGLKPYKCELCEKCFVTKQKHDEHKNTHTGDAPIKCSLCSETFRRHSNLVQHRNRHHFNLKKKVKDYICSCGEIFHSKKKLAWHKEIHDAKPKSCTKCSEKFVHMSSLTRHMRRAHNEKFLPSEERTSENVECPICKGVYLRSSLEVHIRNHSGQRPYTCLICNKDFTTKWNLKLHKWTHASRTSKPFKCDQCKGAFIRESDYVAHMNSHKSVRPYTCNYCGAQFIRKYNCQRHVKEHESGKTFNCQICGKSFHRSYYLKDHMRVHSGVRPYACHICGKTSTTKSNHNKHVQIHHAREPVSTEN